MNTFRSVTAVSLVGGLACAGLSLLTLSALHTPATGTMLWLPTGALLVAGWMGGACAYLAGVIGTAAGIGLAGGDAWQSVPVAVAALTALLLLRAARLDVTLGRPRDHAMLFAGSVAGGTAAFATALAMPANSTGTQDWTTHALAIYLLFPLAFAWLPLHRHGKRDLVELAGLLTITAITAWFVLTAHGSRLIDGMLGPPVLFVIVIAAGLVQGARGALTVVATITAILLHAIAQGALAPRLPFAHTGLMHANAYLMVQVAVGLVLVSVVNAQRRALAESRQAHRALTEAQRIGGIGNWSLDTRTGKIHLSRTMYELLGADPATFHPDVTRCLGLLPEGDRKPLMRDIKALIATRGDIRIDQEVRRADDSGTRVFCIRGSFASGADEHLLVGTARDITETQRAAHALEVIRNRLETTFRTLSEGVVVQDANGRIIEANPSAERLLGLIRHPLTGLTSFDPRWQMVRADGSPLPDDEYPLTMALRTGEQVLGAVIGMLRPDGTHTWISINAIPVRNAGEGLSVVSSFSDITETSRAAAAQARLASLVESADDAIISKSTEGIIRSWNPAAERLFGYAAQDIIGKSIRTLIPDHLQDEETRILANIAAGKLIHHYESVRVSRDGTPIDVELTISPIRDSSGAIVGASKVLRDVRARKAVERALRASEQRLRAFADAMPQLAWIARNDGTAMWFNERWYRYTGNPADTMDARGWLAAVDAAALPAGLADWHALLAGNSSYEAELPLRAANGSYRRFLTRIVPLHDSEGRTMQWVGTHTDVEELRRNQEESTWLAGIVANSADAIFLCSHTSLRIEYANAAGRRGLGCEGDAVLHAMLPDFITPESGTSWPSIQARIAQAAGKRLTLHARQRRPDGDSIPVELNLQRVVAQGDEKLLAFVTDISQRLAAESQLRLLQTSVANLTDIVIITDAEPVTAPGPRIVFVNEAFERITGYRRDEVIGKSPRMLQGPGTDPGTRRDIREALLARRPVQAEILNYGRDRQPYWLEINITPVQDTDGKVTHFVAVERDITPRKEAEEQIRQMNATLERRVVDRTRELAEAKEVAERATRAKSEFLATMSHEIRTPLNAIIGMSHLAIVGETNPRQRDYLQKVHVAGQHLLGLVNNILDLAKVESGKLALEHSEFSLDIVLQTLHALLDEALTRQQRRLVTYIDPAIDRTLRGDALRLEQMLINYANNAIKFSTHGDIRVSVRMLEQMPNDCLLRFEVEDSGVGIAHDILPTLFQPFRQADSSTTRNFGGTGLGLAITGELARLMGGRVGAESEPGAGSRFWFTVRLARTRPAATTELPAPRQATQTQATAVPEDAPLPLANYRLLVVEDNELNQQVARDILAAAGAEVRVADSGARALALLREMPADLVLMDLQMPGMDGIETTKCMKADPALAAIPVIAMTANASREDQQRSFAAGMVDFITKPIGPDKLCRRILEVLASRAGVPATSTADIDVAILAAHVGQDPALHTRYIRLFVETSARQLTEARMALAEARPQRLRDIGHRLKSSARLIGARRFADICAALEEDAGVDPARDAGRLAELDALLAGIAVPAPAQGRAE